MIDQERVVRGRVRVPPGGEQNDRAEIRRAAPELRQPVDLALWIYFDLLRCPAVAVIGGMT